ncbi:envelope integrity protein Cei [Pseudonocardia ailaonensis]
MTGLRPYQRRRMRPMVITVSVLAAIAIVTWSVVLVHSAGKSGVASCNPPASGAVGTVLEAGSLDGTAPVAPSAVKTTVLNAGGQRGQANLVAAQLGDLGFGEAKPPANDPLHPTGDLECHGQLRFGKGGTAAASTLSLVLPCLELLQDGRGDDTVDVAIGTAFTDVNPSRSVRDVLEQLGAPAAGETGEGQQVAAPSVDPQQLENARKAATC